MSEPVARAYIPHVGWLRHEPGEEVVTLLRQGYFEAVEQAFFWLYLRPGDVFVDCGAHIGLYSIIADRATGGAARIVALEPARATAAHLEANLRDNAVRDARVVRAAVWEAPGEIRFIEEEEGRAAYAHAAFGEGGGESVPATTLDAIAREAGAATIALVKIDVEGAEPEALRGARAAIERGALPVLMVEFTEQNLQRRGLGTAELFAQLHAAGYGMYELSAQSLQLERFEPDGPVWYRNLFACRDADAVNERLRGASDANRAIARDVVERARACDRFKELEELDRLRALEDTSAELRRWAEDADARALAAGALAEKNREWAEDSDARTLVARAIAEENREWAERSDAMLAAQKAHSATCLARIQALESEVAADLERVNTLETEIAPLREFARRLRWVFDVLRKRPRRK